ncbi:oligopeptide transporter [Trichosporon asahii var. asahii CBS 8904]|uniref:Oligopeptide transporter n=1 Tax=Trichosporon asahii var. asahii (strain CBS 8904) TaxID=1220162 RepID=K1WK32_TRIAC|nr:oligopeptide transporter [Trichosporon asahii var. asahii CBS 8904]
MSRTLGVLRQLLDQALPGHRPAHEDYELVETVPRLPTTSTTDDDEPTLAEAESLGLRRIAAPVPWPTLALSLVEFAERASYYGAGGVFANFVQRPLPPGSTTGAPMKEGDTPGAMGLGLRVSAALTTTFTMLAFSSPLLGGYLADTRWGRFRSIAFGALLAGLAHAASIWAALPVVITSGTSLPPFLLTLVLLGLSAGLIKASIAPIMAGQCPPDRVRYIPSPSSSLPSTSLPPPSVSDVDIEEGGTEGGEWVVESQELTISRVMGLYYASINVGAFVALGSVWAEAKVGFWAAFAIPGAIFCLMPPLLWVVKPRLVPEAEPSSSALTRVWHVLRDRPRDTAEPFRSSLEETERIVPQEEEPVSAHRLGDESEGSEGSEDGWDFADPPSLDDDRGIETPEPLPADPDRDIRQALKACTLFLWFAIYNVAPGLNSATISLAGAMRGTLPNDALDKMNPLAVICAVPVLNWVYQRLEARGIHLGPVRRVVIGFGLTSLSMLYLALIQAAVYATSPCGTLATDCAQKSPLSNLLVAPGPLLQGVSEALAVVSGMQLAYTMSPPGLQSLVTAVFLSMVAASGALVLLLLPLLRDPLLVYPFALTSLAVAAAGYCVHRRYAHLDT